MARRGKFEDDEYWPEFGTLTVRDTAGHYDDRGVFGQHGSDAQPCGTIVRTGHGWLEGAAGDGPHVVRMEGLLAAPEDDFDEWDDVVDIPYWSHSGAVGLTYVTGGPGDHHLVLNEPGSHRVRVTRKATGYTEALWLLRFWPAEEEPPRWVRRKRPAVSSGGSGWTQVFGYQIDDVLWGVGWAQEKYGMVTVDGVREWGERHHRGADWLDKPLRKLPHEVDPAAYAVGVGVAPPTTMRGMFDFYVAAGGLAPQGNRVQDLLPLPAELTERLNVQYDHNRFCSFASDLVSVAMWGGGKQTVAELAERTLAPEEDVHAALTWAQRNRLLHVEGALTGPFTMTAVPK